MQKSGLTHHQKQDKSRTSAVTLLLPIVQSIRLLWWWCASCFN